MELSDRERLRSLATRWMELAALPVMAERRRLWTALNDLQAERPMALFETWYLEGYVQENELQCKDPYYRDIERNMMWVLRQVEEIGDDFVLESFYRVYWSVDWPQYGDDVALQAAHALDLQGGQVAYNYRHPITTPQDIDRLKPRSWQVDRADTKRRLQKLSDAFGDILPVVLRGSGSLHSGLTQDLFKLIGNDNLLAWTYDDPDALHKVMAYLRDDRLAYYEWREREGLLGLNCTGFEYAGSGSPGYTSALPQSDYAGQARQRDLWVWMESQETSMISPQMFGEFFLPYMAEVCAGFGLVYYGCCEPVHDRWELIRKAIPNVRGVSVSPWCNQSEIAQMLGRDYVYSRKPKAWPISGDTPDWDLLRQDMQETLSAARNCNLEFIYRDVYRIGDRERLGRWASMVKAAVS